MPLRNGLAALLCLRNLTLILIDRQSYQHACVDSQDGQATAIDAVGLAKRCRSRFLSTALKSQAEQLEVEVQRGH